MHFLVLFASGNYHWSMWPSSPWVTYQPFYPDARGTRRQLSSGNNTWLGLGHVWLSLGTEKTQFGKWRLVSNVMGAPGWQCATPTQTPSSPTRTTFWLFESTSCDMFLWQNSGSGLILRASAGQWSPKWDNVPCYKSTEAGITQAVMKISRGRPGLHIP